MMVGKGCKENHVPQWPRIWFWDVLGICSSINIDIILNLGRFQEVKWGMEPAKKYQPWRVRARKVGAVNLLRDGGDGQQELVLWLFWSTTSRTLLSVSKPYAATKTHDCTAFGGGKVMFTGAHDETSSHLQISVYCLKFNSPCYPQHLGFLIFWGRFFF